MVARAPRAVPARCRCSEIMERLQRPGAMHEPVGPDGHAPVSTHPFGPWHAACNSSHEDPQFRRDAREARMESVPVCMTVRWRVPPGEAQSITATLQSLMLKTRVAPGCAGCSVSTEMGAQVVIQYVENWKSETDL